MSADFFVTFSLQNCYISEKNNAICESEKIDARRRSEGRRVHVDNKILEKLYRLYQKELYLYLYSLGGNRQLAEDLLHETFLKALLALPDGHTNIRAWLYMVARNLFYNHQKRRKKEILFGEKDTFPEEKADIDFLEKIIEEENRRKLYQAICRLELRKREIIQMQYFGEMSQKEIAAVLHITPENVRVLGYRAKKELRRYLEKYEEERRK